MPLIKSRRKQTQKCQNILFRTEVIIVSLIFIFCATFVFIGYYSFLRNDSKRSVIEQAKQNDSEIIIDEGCDFFGIVGDDICDDIANTKSCGYDFGDCCIHENDRNSCQNCICYIDTTIHNTFLDFACLNKLSMTLMEDWIYARLGDGYCDLESNLKKYDFDLGDCCIDQVDCFNLGNIIHHIHTH